MIFLYKLIKHRGISTNNIKENTYQAILNALKDAKYVGVEFDIRETKDHEFIIYHDPLYNGKLISSMNFNELPRFMPKLKTILKINSDKIFLIELKNISSYEKFYNLLNRHYKIGILNYVLNTSLDIKKLDFVAILNSLLNDTIINNLKGLEIFSYGLFENMHNKEVFYIVDK